MENKDRPINVVKWMDDGNECLDAGLTKREYFAAMAMQGFISGFNANPAAKDTLIDMDILVKDSVHYADLLLIELEK